MKLSERIAAAEAYETKFKEPAPFSFGMSAEELDKVAKACKAAVKRDKPLTWEEYSELSPKREPGVVL